MAPRKKQVTKMYVATDSGESLIDGTRYPFYEGRTRVEEGHPLLKAAPHCFRELDAHYPVVEQTTAAPGELRGDAA